MLVSILFYLLIGLSISVEIGFGRRLGYILFTLLWCPIMLLGLIALGMEAYEDFKYKRKGDKNEKS